MIDEDAIHRSEQAELVALRNALRELRAERGCGDETLMLFWCPSCEVESAIDPWVFLAPTTTVEKCPACGVTWRVVVAFVRSK